MCFHNSLTLKAVQLKLRFNAESEEDFESEPVYHESGFDFPDWPIITMEQPNILQRYNWGLIPHWSKDRDSALKARVNTLNARCETVFDKPSFKYSIMSKRCLVPSSGFFEWQDYKGKKYPYFIRLRDVETFCMAGIYAHWTDQSTGELFKTFSILTTMANPMMAQIHNLKQRMPVILDPAVEREWLNPELDRAGIEQFFTPYNENKMTAYSISKLITSRTQSSNVPEVLQPFNYPELNPGLFL